VMPLTQLDERAGGADLDNRTLTITFTEPVAIRDLLLQLVRGTNLSITADAAVDGVFIGELKNLTVRQALDRTLAPLGLDYSVDGTFVRVARRALETRLFDVNYIATDRMGSTSIGSADEGSRASVSSTTKTDVFADLEAGVRSLLSDSARFNVDRKAGLVQVSDYPERLERVAAYLDAVQDRVQREAQIDAKILEIELADDKASTVNWDAVAAQMNLASDSTPNAQPNAPRRALSGMRVTDVTRLMTLLEGQGKVTVIATPRVVTMNNEPAIVRTDAVTFSVTPQIADDAVVTLSLSPVVRAPVVAESDMLARVAAGETLVVSGFTYDRETRERKAVGISGGWFGRATVVSRKRVELVILLTPRVMAAVTVP
jgi:MSHA biogenesis protein MshL